MGFIIGDWNDSWMVNTFFFLIGRGVLCEFDGKAFQYLEENLDCFSIFSNFFVLFLKMVCEFLLLYPLQAYFMHLLLFLNLSVHAVIPTANM